MSDLVWFLEKATLNPDLLYNRLLYNRILLYVIPYSLLVAQRQCRNSHSILGMPNIYQV